MSFSITVDADQVRKQLQSLGDKVERRADVHQAMADGGKETVREHFRHLSLTRSRKIPGKRSFYGQARESTVSRADARRAEVEVTGPLGLSQRLHGGTIVAKPGKYLAIPVDSVVAGVRAKEVYAALGLFAIVNRSTGKGVLKSRVDDRVYYALTRSVTQRPDPGVLPTESQILEGAARAAEAYYQMITAKGGTV